MSSLKDTPGLTPELEAAMRGSISPDYARMLGTESHERAALLGEIDRLRAEVAELAQQRGDLAARVLELRSIVADCDVFTLIGHAEYLKGLGQQDMPNYFYELAVRLAKVVGDSELVRRTDELRASRTVSVDGEAT